jgi:hypothetical protein
VLKLSTQRLGQAFHTLLSLAHGAAILGEGDILRGLCKGNLRE